MTGQRSAKVVQRLVVVTGATLALSSLSGCLSDSYRSPDGELARVARLPPDERGGSVRVVQRTVFAEQREAVEAAPAVDPGTNVYVCVSGGGGGHVHHGPAGRPV